MCPVPYRSFRSPDQTLRSLDHEKRRKKMFDFMQPQAVQGLDNFVSSQQIPGTMGPPLPGQQLLTPQALSGIPTMQRPSFQGGATIQERLPRPEPEPQPDILQETGRERGLNVYRSMRPDLDDLLRARGIKPEHFLKLDSSGKTELLFPEEFAKDGLFAVQDFEKKEQVALQQDVPEGPGAKGLLPLAGLVEETGREIGAVATGGIRVAGEQALTGAGFDVPQPATEQLKEGGLTGLIEAGEEVAVDVPKVGPLGAPDVLNPLNWIALPIIDPAVAKALSLTVKGGTRLARPAVEAIAKRVARLAADPAAEPAAREGAQRLAPRLQELLQSERGAAQLGPEDAARAAEEALPATIVLNEKLGIRVPRKFPGARTDITPEETAYYVLDDGMAVTFNTSKSPGNLLDFGKIEVDIRQLEKPSGKGLRNTQELIERVRELNPEFPIEARILNDRLAKIMEKRYGAKPGLSGRTRIPPLAEAAQPAVRAGAGSRLGLGGPGPPETQAGVPDFLSPEGEAAGLAREARLAEEAPRPVLGVLDEQVVKDGQRLRVNDIVDREIEKAAALSDQRRRQQITREIGGDFPERLPRERRQPITDDDAVGDALERLSGQPDRAIPLTVRTRHPQLQQYLDTQDSALVAREQSGERLKFVSKAVKDGIQPEAELVRATAQRDAARQAVKDARLALNEANVRVGVEDMSARARTLGADDAHVDVLEAGYRDAAELINSNEPLLNASELRQRVARVAAAVQGTPPGQVGHMAQQRHIVHSALSRLTADQVDKLGRTLDTLLVRDAKNVTYRGPAKYAELVESLKGTIDEKVLLMTHPDWFDGVSRELKESILESNVLGLSKVNAAKAWGYPIEAIDDLYLEQMWDIPRGQLEAVVPRFRGKVSVAKERMFNDPIEGLVEGYRFKDMTVGEIVEHSFGLLDTAAADAYLRRLVLERFGVRGTRTVASGYREFAHPMYRGWSGPSAVTNAVDQLYNPAGVPGLAGAADVAAASKGTVFGLMDIGVFGTHMLDTVLTGGPRLLAASINRGLRTLNLPHAPIWAGDTQALGPVVNAQLAGVNQSLGPSAIKLKGGTLVQYMPLAGKAVDKPISAAIDRLARIQFSGILRPLRNLLYEGNLLTLHLTGSDVQKAAVKRIAGDGANAWTGASRGAMTPGRRQAENTLLTSAQMGRSEMARLGQIAKALTPAATREERVLAAVTLASFAGMVYGVGSAINMAFGNGPVEFDPRKGDWASIEVAGHKVPLVARRSLIRAMAKSFDVIVDEEKREPGAVPRIWSQFAVAKFNPVTAPAQSALGVGFEPGTGRFEVGGLSPKGRLLNMAPLPPIAETAITEPRQRTSPVGMGLEFTGFGVFPKPGGELLEEARKREMEKVGFTGNWEQFKADFPAEAARASESEAVQSAIDIIGQDAPETEESRAFAFSENLRNVNAEAQQQDDVRLNRGAMNGEIWKDGLRDRQKALFDQREAIYEFSGIKFDETEPTKGTPGAALKDYFDIDIDTYTDQQSGEVEWDGFFAAKKAALQPLTAKERRELERDVIHKFDTPTVREFRKAKDVVNEVFEIPKYKGLTLAQGEQVEEFIGRGGTVEVFQLEYERETGRPLERPRAILRLLRSGAVKSEELERFIRKHFVSRPDLPSYLKRPEPVSPERDALILENQALLAKFYPELVQNMLNRSQEAQLGEAAFERLTPAR
ncbi:hypothetical protein LCGC14_0693090 [marine sediment metagenome]|uniref:Uncharacterized protein n=1 Tax=marine sediment metagenome TaxID=412755 RepID=A0A0F9TST4_9ZZZZ